VKQSINIEWMEKISKLDKVSELEPVGNNIFVLTVQGGDDSQTDLLKDLMDLKLDIISYKESGVALENLYMSMIKESR